MAITTAPTRSNGRRTAEGTQLAGPRAPVRRRHRQLPLVVVGVVLVVGCALAFADASLRLGGGEEVLVVAQPLSVGQVLTAGDLRAVRLSSGGGIATVPAGEEQAVVGQPAAVALGAGSLLTRADVGSRAPVSAGSDVVAVGLKPGAYPPDLAPADRVQVVPVASSATVASAGFSAGSPVSATVLAVQAPSATSGSPAVFSLEVARSDAEEVASLAAAGEAALLQVGTGG